MLLCKSQILPKYFGILHSVAIQCGVLVMQILMGIGELLNEPNNSDPAQFYGYDVYKNNKKKYEK